MDKTIKEQLEAIRRSLETNMLDVNKVQGIANREGYYELVVFIEEHQSEYVSFIFHGDSAGNITTGETENTEDTENETESAEGTENVIQEVTGCHYNLTGQKRKELVEAISRILSLPAVYQKAPTFSYRIGDYTVDRNGSLTFSSSVPSVEVQKLVTNLQEQGYIAEDAPNTQSEAEPIIAEEDEEEAVTGTETTVPTVLQDDEAVVGIPENAIAAEIVQETSPEIDRNPENSNNLTIEIPRNILSDTAYVNLQKIIASKATLLKQALETETLEIEELDDKLCFPWFTLHDGLEGEADAYAQLITAMVEMAKKQKRVVATEKPLENAKLTMRLFLIRLGFIGDAYKTARKILLRNLSGNSSWRYGKPQKKSAVEEAPHLLNPQEANPQIPEEALLDAATIPANTEATDTLSIPENTEKEKVSEDIYTDYSDAFPEDKGGAPYDK